MARVFDDCDEMIEIEQELIERLGAGSELDEHDMGLGEINVFIRTEEPPSTLEDVRSAPCHRPIWPLVRGISAGHAIRDGRITNNWRGQCGVGA